MNNLYIINEVLYDYTPGMAVIAAPSLDACREIFAAKFEMWADEIDSSIADGDYTVIRNVDRAEGVISYVVGGG